MEKFKNTATEILNKMLVMLMQAGESNSTLVSEILQELEARRKNEQPAEFKVFFNSDCVSKFFGRNVIDACTQACIMFEIEHTRISKVQQSTSEGWVTVNHKYAAK